MGADIAAVLNMFLDPASAVKRIDSKWIWVFPLALLGIISAAIGWLTIPITMQLMVRNATDASQREAMQRSLPMIETFSKVGVFASPVIVVILTLLIAALLLVACQVMGIPAKFKELFNLISMASIIKAVNALAAFLVIKLKGDEIQTMQDLSPPFGLDIFLPDGTGKVLLAAVNFFSIFQIWYLIAIAIGLAAFTKISKGKAFAAITPIWIFPLIFVIGGAFFRRT